MPLAPPHFYFTSKLEDHIVVSHGRPFFCFLLLRTALQLNGPEPKSLTETGPDISGSQNSEKLKMDFLQSAQRGDSEESSTAFLLRAVQQNLVIFLKKMLRTALRQPPPLNFASGGTLFLAMSVMHGFFIRH